MVDFGEKAGLVQNALGGAWDIFTHISSHGTPEERRICLVAAGQRWVDEILVPYDIEQIPNWAEGFVDKLISKGASAAIEQVLDKIESFFK